MNRNRTGVLALFASLLLVTGYGAGFKEDFEDGSSGQFSGGYSITSSPSIGSYSYGKSGSASGTIASTSPDSWNGGIKPDWFEYEWYETGGSYGGGLAVYDSSGNGVAGMLTDNPQWYILDGCGWNYIGSGDYGDWTDVRFEFNWGSGTYDYTIDSPSNYESGTANLCTDSDLETIKMRYACQPSDINDWNGCSGNPHEMWYDEFDTASVNSAPDSPSNPVPSDGETAEVNTPNSTVNLSANFSDPDGDSGALEFYNASSDTKIGSCNVESGKSCNVSWSNLSVGQEISWYAVADDGEANKTGPTWSFSPEIKICDKRDEENDCISNSSHTLSDETFEIDTSFESEREATLDSLTGTSNITVSGSVMLSGLWNGSFRIYSLREKTTLRPGSEFKPRNGRIILGK